MNPKKGELLKKETTNSKFKCKQNKNNQVISNLINNAIKFSTYSIIKFIFKKYVWKKVYINVKDTSRGYRLSVIRHQFSSSTKSKREEFWDFIKNIVEDNSGKT